MNLVPMHHFTSVRISFRINSLEVELLGKSSYLQFVLLRDYTSLHPYQQ